MSAEKLAIFCVAGCVNGAMQRILIDPADRVAVCPSCHRSYGVSTGLLEQVSAKRMGDGRYRYLLEEAESHGGRRLRKVETRQSLGLQAGSLVTLVRRGPILIGLADHGREVWFSIEPSPTIFRGGKRFFDFMSAVILFCAFLTAIGWAASVDEWVASRGREAVMALVLIGAFLLAVPALSSHLNLRLTSSRSGKRGDDDDRPGLPPLQLPDID